MENYSQLFAVMDFSHVVTAVVSLTAGLSPWIIKLARTWGTERSRTAKRLQEQTEARSVLEEAQRKAVAQDRKDNWVFLEDHFRGVIIELQAINGRMSEQINAAQEKYATLQAKFFRVQEKLSEIQESYDFLAKTHDDLMRAKEERREDENTGD